MQILMTIVLHLLLIGSMLAFLWAAVVAIRDTRDRQERLLRAGAAFAAALVVLGSQAAGLPFSDFIVRALSGSTVMGQGATALAVVVPSALGLAVGWYFLRAMRLDKDRALRVFAFVGTLAAVQFAQIYAVAVDANGLRLGAAAIPNISFVVAILLYAALRYQTSPSGRRERSKVASFAERFMASKFDGAPVPRNPVTEQQSGFAGFVEGPVDPGVEPPCLPHGQAPRPAADPGRSGRFDVPGQRPDGEGGGLLDLSRTRR